LTIGAGRMRRRLPFRMRRGMLSRRLSVSGPTAATVRMRRARRLRGPHGFPLLHR
jgi:hypothetical protein